MIKLMTYTTTAREPDDIVIITVTYDDDGIATYRDLAQHDPGIALRHDDAHANIYTTVAAIGMTALTN